MDTDDIVKHYEFFISIDAYAGKQELFREMRYIEDRVNLVKEFASHGIHLCDGDFYLTPKIEIKVKEENINELDSNLKNQNTIIEDDKFICIFEKLFTAAYYGNEELVEEDLLSLSWTKLAVMPTLR